MLTSCLIPCSSLFVSIAQVIFRGNLAGRLQQLGIDGFHGALVAPTGLAGLTNGLSGDQKKAVLAVINDASADSWRLPIILTYVCRKRWQDIKPTKKKKKKSCQMPNSGFAAFVEASTGLLRIYRCIPLQEDCRNQTRKPGAPRLCIAVGPCIAGRGRALRPAPGSHCRP